MDNGTEREQGGFTLSYDDNDIAWLAIDTPGESVNILKASFVQEIDAVLTALQAQPPLGLVICSQKPGNFIAGADITMFDRFHSVSDAKQTVQKGQEIFTRLSTLPFPVIAAIQGACLGGGLELALACDYRICSDDPQTVLGLPELQLGVLPGLGGTQRLPRLTGLLSALDLILTGKRIRAKKALKLGLVDACVDKDGLLDAASQIVRFPTTFVSDHRDWKARAEHWLSRYRLIRHLIIRQARNQAQKKARHHYPAIDAVLDVIQYGLDEGVEAGLMQEAQWFAQLVFSPESVALRSVFLGTTRLKRELKPDIPLPEVKQVAILGGGMMGAGISYITATKAGKNVRIKDISAQGVLHAFRYVYEQLCKKQQRRILSEAKVRATMARLSGCTDYTGFKQVDIVVEAVFEDLALKQQMVCEIEANTHPETIFATNTSSLPIHQIARVASRPEHVVGLHYFSPAEKMPLVEVIPHPQTSEQTLSQVIALAYAQGKTPIVVQDQAGFYVNRILARYLNGALQCLADGEPVEVIDQAMMDFGFPVGPLALLDEVGFDVAIKISPILVRELGERFHSPDFLARLAADNRKGRKSGVGFYRYHRRGKRVDEQIYPLLGVEKCPALGHDVIVMRCVLPLLSEAVLCLEELVIRSADDGDIGAIFGIGFPPFLGGPFRYMDYTGLETIARQMEQLSSVDFHQASTLLRAKAEAGQRFYAVD